MDEYASEWATALCGKWYECRDPSEMSEFADEADCVETKTDGKNGWTDSVMPYLDSGECQYDEEKAGDCVSGIASLSCAELESENTYPPEACDEVFTGSCWGPDY